jgi:hypothetical protein
MVNALAKLGLFHLCACCLGIAWSGGLSLNNSFLCFKAILIHKPTLNLFIWYPECLKRFRRKAQHTNVSPNFACISLNNIPWLKSNHTARMRISVGEHKRQKVRECVPGRKTDGPFLYFTAYLKLK